MIQAKSVTVLTSPVARGGSKMYCKECGKEIAEDGRFCESCGTDNGEAKTITKEELKQKLRTPSAIKSQNQKQEFLTAADYGNFNVESKYRALKIYVHVMKFIGVALAIGVAVLIHQYEYYMYNDVTTRLLIYGIPCGSIIAIFYGMANKMEIMISLEETNRQNGLLLRALFDKLREIEG